jgi:hypothetical protein
VTATLYDSGLELQLGLGLGRGWAGAGVAARLAGAKVVVVVEEVVVEEVVVEEVVVEEVVGVVELGSRLARLVAGQAIAGACSLRALWLTLIGL